MHIPDKPSALLIATSTVAIPGVLPENEQCASAAIARYQQYTQELNATFERLPWAAIHSMVQTLHAARLDEHQVFVLGNGGSAATALHLAGDLNHNTVVAGVPRFRVLTLNSNMASFSACANDMGYEHVFSEQLANFLRPGDVVVAISTSGNSANVLQAVAFAQTQGAITIGLSGYHGGQLAGRVDIPVVVDNHCIEQIEDVHMMLVHLVTTALRWLASHETECQ